MRLWSNRQSNRLNTLRIFRAADIVNLQLLPSATTAGVEATDTPVRRAHKPQQQPIDRPSNNNGPEMVAMLMMNNAKNGGIVPNGAPVGTDRTREMRHNKL